MAWLRSRGSLALLAGALTAGAPGCRSAAVKTADVEVLAAADANEFRGCYDCLVDAHDTYLHLAVGKTRPLVIARLFETDLLLTLRRKELAMDAAEFLTEARALAPELEITISADRYLADVDDVLPDDLGTPQRDRMRLAAAHGPRSAGLNAEVDWLAAGPLRAPVDQYLALALDCSYGARARSGHPAYAPPADAPPLVQYRKAICEQPDDDALTAVRTAVPRFVETSLFLARRAVAQAKSLGPAHARALLSEAFGRFPDSPSVTYLDGNLNQLAGDCTRALGRYDATLMLRPTHENALLGRTACLSYLLRYEEAIASATHMLEIDAKPADALYWRAWNWRELKQLDRARTDIEAAKARGFRVDVLRLAGMIEHDQDDLDPAEIDLLGAVRARGNEEDCVARWYLGLVYMKKTRWTDSGAAFDAATTCYRTAVAIDLEKLNEMRARTDLDPEFQTSQISGFEAALAEDRSQEYAAAFNAANHYARGGDLAKARPLLDIAAQDPALADRVKALRDLIKAPASRPIVRAQA
jgi:tetratricopeptide (TPR) repeat protein